MKKSLCFTVIMAIVVLCGISPTVNAGEINDLAWAEVTVELISHTGEVLDTGSSVELAPWYPIGEKVTLTISDSSAFSYPVQVRAAIGAVFDYTIVDGMIYGPGTYVGMYYINPRPAWAGANGEFGAKVWLRWQSEGEDPVIDTHTDLYDVHMPE